MSEPPSSRRASPPFRVILLAGVVLGMVVAFITPQFVPGEVIPETLWRRTNLLFLLIHGLLVGWAFAAAATTAWKLRTSWKPVFFIGVLFATMVLISSAAAFGWMETGRMTELGRTQNLAAVTSFSAIIVLMELLYLRLVLHNWRILYHSSRGNYETALRLITARLYRANVSYFDQIYAGIFHLRLGHHEVGEQLVAEGLANSKRDPIALTHVAHARYIQERYAEGLALTDEVIATIGSQPLLLLNRCVFLVALNRVAEAREMWVQVEQLQDPNTLVPKNDRDGQLVLARVKAALGETEASIAAVS